MNTDVYRDVASANDVPLLTNRASWAVEDTLPSSAQKKTKILFLAVNDDPRSLNLDEEYRQIDLSISRQSRLELASKLAPRLNELQQGLLHHMPDVVHFGGHGNPAGELMLRDEAGALFAVTPDALRSLFAAHHGNVRLVILNACFSAAQALAVRDSVGVAVGMRRQISDRAAIVFAAAFYEALAYRRPVREAFDLGVAAIKLHGMFEEADTPKLLVRPDLDASSVYLVAACTSPGYPGHSSLPALRTRRMLFLVLLAASVTLTALYGSGILRQNIISDYTVLVILGCLAGILGWGILSSSALISASRHGIMVKLGGSSLTVGATIAGGLWFATAESEFAVKVKFVDESRQSVNVSGTLRLEIDAYTIPTVVRGADLVELGQLPRRMAGRVASLTFESSGFKLGLPDQKYRIQPGEMLLVPVRPISRTKISGTVSFEGARMPGGQISVAGRDCGDNVRDGFFEISCEETSLPIKVQIRVPELYTSRICTREVMLKTFTNNEVVLEGCANPAANGGGPPTRGCTLRSPDEIIRREADLVRQHDLRVIALFAPSAEVIDAHSGQARSPRERYQSEFAMHRFAEASHSDIRYVKSESGTAFYTSSSAGRFLEGGGYHNPGPSDHWIFEKLGDCWRIKSLIINAAQDRDRRFTAE